MGRGDQTPRRRHYVVTPVTANSSGKALNSCHSERRSREESAVVGSSARAAASRFLSVGMTTLLASTHGSAADPLRLHYVEQEPRSLHRRDRISHGASLTPSRRRRRRVHAPLPCASFGLFPELPQRRRRDRTRNGNQEMASREEGCADRRTESNLGGLGGGLGRTGSDAPGEESRFLPAVGMTNFRDDGRA
jgi:hypothetical protein